MKRMDIHNVNRKELLDSTTKVIYAFRAISGKKVLSEIQEDYILCSLKDIPQNLQEAFVYKSILEKHQFLIQIIPNTLKLEALSQEEINNLLNKI